MPNRKDILSARKKGLVAYLDLLPPPVARIMAFKPVRKGVRPTFDLLTNLEIHQRSGIPLRTIVRICQKPSFRDVKPELIDRFLVQGCGINPMELHKHLFRLKRIIKSMHGLSGTWHLRITRNLSPQMKTARVKHLRKLTKLLEE